MADLTPDQQQKLWQTGTQAFDTSTHALGNVFGMLEDERNRNREVVFNANRYRNEAMVAGYEAEYARTMAAIKAKEIVRNFKREEGKMRVSMAASGVVITDGSAVDALMDRASEAGRAKEYAQFEGEMKAWRYTNSAALAEAQREQVINAGKPTVVSRYKQAMELWDNGQQMWNDLSAFTGAIDEAIDQKRRA